MKKICVIGNYSGRNAGDAAILGNLLEDISSLYPGCEFLIPTINTKFIQESYSQYNVKPVGLMPWNLSVKIFGIPLLRSVLASDLILVTDAILFDYKLLNPLHNYLSTLSIVLPFAKKRGIPIVLYNVSLGPVYSTLGKKCFNRIINSSNKILLRDRESYSLLKDLNPNYSAERVYETADSALNTTPSLPSRLHEIKAKDGILMGDMPWISLNISSYLDIFVRGYRKDGISKEGFLNIVADVMDKTIETLGVNIVIVITQYMDISIGNQLYKRLRNKERVKMITNKDYSYQDLALVFSQVEMHIGMRTHSLILASSVLTPVVGIIATPKNRGYMSTIKQEACMIEFKDFTFNSFFSLIESTWYKRKKIIKELAPVITNEKKKARQAAVYLKEFF